MTSFLDIFGNDTVPPSEAAYIRHSITGNAQLVWPYNFGGIDFLTADITEIQASAAGFNVILPPASEVSVGQDILIRNVGANSFNVVNFANGAITTILAGEAKYIYVTDNTTEAGVWGLFTYGAGTSGADASLLAGEGLQANANQLRVNALYRGTNSSITLGPTDRGKVVEVITGSVIVTLPQASVAGDGYYVFIRNSSAGSTVVEGFGTEEIDGSLNKSLAPGESAIFIGNGTYWMTVGFGRDSTFVFSEVVVNAALGNIVLSSADVAGRMIRVSGVATGNVIITLPSVDNIYFVNVEAGMGGFNVTFKTAGVGSVVTLFANQSTVLYCDGTNVTTAINTILVSSLSLADGSALAPSFNYSLDTDTGLYRSGSGQVSVTSNGVETVRFGPAGIELGGNATSTAFVPSGDIVATNVQAAIQELDADKVPRTATTGAAVIPSGTTGQRPGSPVDGYMRFNQTLLQFEGFFNSNWQSVGGGQLLGNAVTKAIFYNSTTIGENLTVAAGTNGGTFGPVTINDGFTVTVSDGSVWTVV